MERQPPDWSIRILRQEKSEPIAGSDYSKTIKKNNFRFSIEDFGLGIAIE
jgi:benzoyl-CoA reductase/2-hydroxyglutaryl-CoA dehydratase subunit BcrC/BadD/HgdB